MKLGSDYISWSNIETNQNNNSVAFDQFGNLYFTAGENNNTNINFLRLIPTANPAKADYIFYRSGSGRNKHYVKSDR
jgi:hypothetical protein